MRTLIGHEYEVRCEDMESGTLDGWFRAKYLTPHARQMGWLWEIDDPRFVKLGIEEVHIVEVRPLSNARIDRNYEARCVMTENCWKCAQSLVGGTPCDVHAAVLPPVRSEPLLACSEEMLQAAIDEAVRNGLLPKCGFPDQTAADWSRMRGASTLHCRPT